VGVAKDAAGLQEIPQSAVKNLEFADFSMRRWRIPAVDFAGIHGL
jgi:hypothetical protein